MKSITIDPLSATLFRVISVPKELALLTITGQARTWTIPISFQAGKLVINLTLAERAVLIPELKERIFLYDGNVDDSLAESLLVASKWVPWVYGDNNKWWVNGDVGEVMNEEGELLGSRKHDNKIEIKNGKTHIQRSHVVFLAYGMERKSKNYTADHAVPSDTFNDSIKHLSWRTKSEQNLNRDTPVPSQTYSRTQVTGSVLPNHPTHKSITLTSDGFVKNGNTWSKGYLHQTGYYDVKINGSLYGVHVLMAECILGRKLLDDESVGILILT